MEPMKMTLAATDENPMGVEWPGSGYAEPGSPIWVIKFKAISSPCTIAELVLSNPGCTLGGVDAEAE